MAGVAAMARAGAKVIIDDAFVGAAASQRRWREALGSLPVLWVGVRCDARVAASREIARGNRIPGMAAAQAAAVHDGVVYDIEVDSTHAEAMDCARTIAARVTGSWLSAPRASRQTLRGRREMSDPLGIVVMPVTQRRGYVLEV
jgi:chloramphenicol 3-O phosphotransferase